MSDELLASDALPRVAVRYDAARQQVAIDAPLSMLSMETLALNSPSQGANIRADASPGTYGDTITVTITY